MTDDQIVVDETISDGKTFTGSEEYTCSSNAGDYAGDGKYTFSEDNTATLKYGTETITKNVTVRVDCYAPVVSKTAAGTYDERHEWDVEKTVSPISQSAFAGDTVSYEWTVVVTESVTEETFKVAGEISVVNPAPTEMTVDLFDELGGGTDAVIGICTHGTYAAGKLTIPPLITGSLSTRFSR